MHTTTEHPFLTNDRGFVDAVKLVPGEHVTKLDGSLGVVVAVQVVPGQAVRYNLTVQDEHTFAVGQGQWVVHNANVCTTTDRDLYRSGNTTDPKLDNVRDGKDIPKGASVANNTDKVIVDDSERVMGQSTFAKMAPGKGIWRLPKGTDLAQFGLRALNDVGEHWAIQPLEDGMAMTDYVDGLRKLGGLFVKTWVV